MPLDIFKGDQQQVFLDPRNPFERADQAFLQALRGDVKGVGRALVQPTSLSPEERKSLSERLGIKGGPLEFLVDVSSNPLVITGAVLALAFKLPHPSQIMAYSGGVRKAVARLPFLDWISPLSENFRRTEVPALVEQITKTMVDNFQRPSLQVAKALDKYAEVAGKLDEEGMLRVVANLDGLDRGGTPTILGLRQTLEKMGHSQASYQLRQGLRLRRMTRAEERLAGDLRGILDAEGQIFKEGRNGKIARATLRELMGHHQATTKGTVADDLFEDYYPHVMPRGLKSEEEYLQGLVDRFSMGEGLDKKLMQIYKHGQEVKQVTPHALIRTSSMIPELESLRKLGVDEATLKSLQATGLAEYSIDLIDPLETYFSKLAKTRAWNLPLKQGEKPLGVKLLEITQELGEQGGIGINKASLLKNQIVPMLLGGKTLNQMESSLKWIGFKSEAIKALDPDGTNFVAKMLPEDVKRPLREWLAAPSRSFSGATGDLASYFYTSTLGLNIPSALLNLSQTPATMLGFVEPGDMIKGYKEVLERGRHYLKYRESGMHKADALAKAMPEFAAEHGELRSLTREALGDTLEQVFTETMKSKALNRSGFAKVNDGFMALFSATEQYNRASAFYAARNRALRVMKGGDWYDPIAQKAVKVTNENLGRASNDFAREVMTMTQFGGGIMNVPQMFLEMNPLLRQFTTFPTRLLGLATGPLNPIRNPGGFGRTVASAGLLYEGWKEMFGADISRGTLVGGLPGPSEGLPFSPLPVVPPVVQIAGSLLDPSEYMPKTLPLLFPGGVSISRALTQVPGIGKYAGQIFNKPYADYGEAIQDDQGYTRIPLKTSDGRLIHYQSIPQMLLRAIGSRHTDDRQEAAMMGWLLDNRERIRQYKKDFMESLVINDSREMVNISQEYERAYPMLGGIQALVSKQDFRSIHLRRDVSRMERALESMPAEVRPQFQALLATSMASNSEALMGLQENGLLMGSTITQRDAYRYEKRPYIDRAYRGGQSMHGVKFSDKLKQAGILQSGEQRAQQDSSMFFSRNRIGTDFGY